VNRATPTQGAHQYISYFNTLITNRGHRDDSGSRSDSDPACRAVGRSSALAPKPFPRVDADGKVLPSHDDMSDKLTIREFLIATWGVLGVLTLLGQAIWRLGGRALEVTADDLSTTQLAVYAGWIVFSVYGEGYRAFQRRFSPRVVARALALSRSPNALHIALAPAFCMSLFHATKRGRTVAWSTVTLVVLLVMVVSRLPYPWRGIIDGGVALALIWGAGAIVFFYLRAILVGAIPDVDPALPPLEHTASVH